MHTLHAVVREEKWDLSLGKLKVQGKFLLMDSTDFMAVDNVALAVSVIP